MAPSWGSWRASWLLGGALGGHAGSNVGVLGLLAAILATTWGVLGPSWLQLGRFGCHLGPNLGSVGAIPGPRWARGRIRLQLGGLGRSWAPCWEVWVSMFG